MNLLAFLSTKLMLNTYLWFISLDLIFYLARMDMSIQPEWWFLSLLITLGVCLVVARLLGNFQFCKLEGILLKRKLF
jgi:hypothetical protein